MNIFNTLNAYLLAELLFLVLYEIDVPSIFRASYQEYRLI